VLMGLPSSGKSTIARLLSKELSEKYGILNVVIGTDDVRRLIPRQLEQFDPNLEPFIKDLTLNIIQFCLKNNYSVINDDMNYYKSMRHELKQIAEENRAHFVLIYILINLETALKWNENRGLPIPPEVIQKVYSRLDPPGDYKWDTPLLTIQSTEISPELAVKKIISKLLPILNTPFISPDLSTPIKPSKREKFDKITRNVVTNFAKTYRDPILLKKISNFRINYLKNLTDDNISEDILRNDFSQKLNAFILKIRQDE